MGFGDHVIYHGQQLPVVVLLHLGGWMLGIQQLLLLLFLLLQML